MELELVGRIHERKLLNQALQSKKPELIVMYGRRRIGKTFLIRQTLKKDIFFEITGIYNVPLKDQLANFHLKLSGLNPKLSPPNSWIEAFHNLELTVLKSRSKRKKVIFIDEFPWLDTPRSNFLPAFENFWNGFVSKRSDMLVIICGSAASYMIKKIVKNKGGLHNRLTERIRLNPFTLHETERLLVKNGVRLTKYDITQLYMCMGGVPYYLEKITPGESVAQTIDRLCFSDNGFLRLEFDNLFASLFDQYENHESIIRALSKAKSGLTRTALLAKTDSISGGAFTKVLNELTEAGFIEKTTPFKRIKDATYRIIDEYSLFYLKYIEHTSAARGNSWISMAQKQSYKSWSGISFEAVCLKHIPQIKEALKITGVNSNSSTWSARNQTKNAQIDLLIDRDDNVINVCEIKFYNSQFSIDKKYGLELKNKLNSFREQTSTNKSLFLTIISTYGVKPNAHSTEIVQNEVTLEHLFKKL
ncbi:MAG: ATP-binding protein [Flavobacteriales bacterium]